VVELDVEAESIGKILWQDRADNTASPSHLHVYVRVQFKCNPDKFFYDDFIGENRDF